MNHEQSLLFVYTLSSTYSCNFVSKAVWNSLFALLKEKENVLNVAKIEKCTYSLYILTHCFSKIFKKFSTPFDYIYQNSLNADAQ